MNTNEISTNIIIIHVCSEYLAAIMATSPNKVRAPKWQNELLHTFAACQCFTCLYVKDLPGASFWTHTSTISFLCEGWSVLMWHNITDSPNLKVSGPRLGPAIVEPLPKTSQNVAMNCNTQIFINFLLQIFRPASYSMFPVGAVLGVQASSNIIQPKTHGECQVPLYGLVYGDLVMQRKNVGLKICPNWIMD